MLTVWHQPGKSSDEGVFLRKSQFSWDCEEMVLHRREGPCIAMWRWASQRHFIHKHASLSVIRMLCLRPRANKVHRFSKNTEYKLQAKIDKLTQRKLIGCCQMSYGYWMCFHWETERENMSSPGTQRCDSRSTYIEKKRGRPWESYVVSHRDAFILLDGMQLEAMSHNMWHG